MMKSVLSALCLFVLAIPTCGQDVPLTVDGKQIKIDKIITIKVDATLVDKLPANITAPANGFNYVWSYPDGVQVKKKGNVLTILGAPKGEMTVSLEMSVVDFKAQTIKTVYGETTFIVGDVPPGPGPGPTPPGPIPIPAAGLRVMIVFDKAKMDSKAQPGQYAAVYGQEFRKLLESSCIAEPETGKKAYRIWASDITPAGDLKLWADAFALPRPTLPWLIVSNGKAGYSGPLPLKLEDSIALVNKYASTGGSK